MRDYDIKMLHNIMLDNSLMANLVDSYNKFASGKKTIVFAVDIEHSKEIAKRYLSAGISAAHIDAETPKNERAEILNRFKSGEVKVLCNVNIVSEGFDVPDCEAVQLARPTKSLVLYLQQVGRCMRPDPDKNEKTALVLDNAGLWLEHGLSYIDRDWSLEGVKKFKKQKSVLNEIVALDEEGIIRQIKKPNEAEGLQLRELTEELERLLVFESFLKIAIFNEHKLASAVIKYKDYLITKSIEMSDVEKSYCVNRLQKLNYPEEKSISNVKGYLFHIKNDIKKAIEENKTKI